MTKQKSLKKNAILNVIRSIMNLIFPLITFPYTSRILMPDGIGKVRFAQSIVSYFTLIAGLGIGTYAIREAAQRRNDQQKLNKFCKEIFLINILSMLVALTLFGITIISIPRLKSMTTLLLICGLSIVFEVFSMNWLFTAVEEFSYITIRSIIFQIISLILLFVMVKTKEDVLQYAFLSVIASGGSSICNFIYKRKFISFKVHEPLNLRPHLKPIFTFFAMALIINIYTVFDTSMLGFLSTETQVGYYSAATKLNKLVLSIITAACAVVLPRLSSLVIKDKNNFFQLFYKTISFVFMLSIPAMIGLTLLTPQIIYLFCGEMYMPACNTMRVMNPIILIIGLSSVMGGQFFVSIKKEKLTVFSVGIGATVNFAMNLFLIPRYGAFGAGISTVCAETMVTLTDFILARKMISLKFVAKDFVQYIIATVFMSVAVLLIKHFFTNRNTILWAGILSGAVVYILTLVLMKNQIAMKILTTVSSKIKIWKHKEIKK